MMKTEKKVVIKIASDDLSENAKTSRRTLKDIKNSTTDKENLVGRPLMPKGNKIYSESEKSETKKKTLMQNKAVQVGDCVITTDDLISDEPNTDYWKKLAETRGDALDRSIQENEKLKEDIGTLQEENRICKEMLDESRSLVEVLQEMISEQEGDSEEIPAAETS